MRNGRKFNINTTKKGIEKRTFEGIVFDSEMELKYYRDYLLPLKDQGQIVEIVLQPEYILQTGFSKNGKKILPIRYVGDFEVEYSNKKIVTYDVKGLPTPEAKMKRKMFDYKFPDKSLEWVALSKQDGGWIPYDDLVKARQKRKKESGK